MTPSPRSGLRPSYACLSLDRSTFFTLSLTSADDAVQLFVVWEGAVSPPFFLPAIVWGHLSHGGLDSKPQRSKLRLPNSNFIPDPQPSTLNQLNRIKDGMLYIQIHSAEYPGETPKPCTLNLKPEILNPQPVTQHLNPKPCTLSPKSETLHPQLEPCTLNRKAETLHPQPEALHPQI